MKIHPTLERFPPADEVARSYIKDAVRRGEWRRPIYVSTEPVTGELYLVDGRTTLEFLKRAAVQKSVLWSEASAVCLRENSTGKSLTLNQKAALHVLAHGTDPKGVSFPELLLQKIERIKKDDEGAFNDLVSGTETSVESLITRIRNRNSLGKSLKKQKNREVEVLIKERTKLEELAAAIRLRMEEKAKDAGHEAEQKIRSQTSLELQELESKLAEIEARMRDIFNRPQPKPPEPGTKGTRDHLMSTTLLDLEKILARLRKLGTMPIGNSDYMSQAQRGGRSLIDELSILWDTIPQIPNVTLSDDPFGE